MNSHIPIRFRLAPLVNATLGLLLLCLGMVSTVRSQPRLPRGTKSGFVTTVDNVRIHYLEAKPKSLGRGPAILFVPGLMTPGWIWEYQLAHFAKKYRTIAIDPRSQGSSSKPAEGHYPAARARDIKSVVDQLRLEPVVIVAATSAVTEVISYVDQFGTQRVAGLVLVNGIAGRDYDKETMDGLLAYAQGFQVNRRSATERFVRGLYRQTQHEAYIKRMVDATMQMPTDSAVALIVGGLTSDNRQALAKVDKPTLIVVAEFGPWMSFYKDMHGRIRGARMEVLENVGHALFVDDPIRFNQLLDKFLEVL